MDGTEIIGSVAGISGVSFAASWAVAQYRIKVIEKRIELDKRDHIEAQRHQSEERKKAVIEITQLVNEKVVERKKETDGQTDKRRRLPWWPSAAGR